MDIEVKKPVLRVFEFQPKPNNPKEAIEVFVQKFSDDEIFFSLTSLVLELTLDSETPFYKFLEQQPCRINIDKIERKRYLLSGTLLDFRLLYQELKEQKVAKALLTFLCENYPEFFKDLWPKRGIVPPIGINFRALSQSELNELDLAVKLRHLYFLTEFLVAKGHLLFFYQAETKPLITGENPKTYCLANPFDKNLLTWVVSVFNDLESLPEMYPQAVATSGFIYQPLIQYMPFLTRFLAQENHPLKEASFSLLEELKKIYPEPFGLIPVS
ncbi:hypothetical protein [Thermodesulfatator atlanticus]